MEEWANLERSLRRNSAAEEEAGYYLDAASIVNLKQEKSGGGIFVSCPPTSILCLTQTPTVPGVIELPSATCCLISRSETIMLHIMSSRFDRAHVNRIYLRPSLA